MSQTTTGRPAHARTPFGLPTFILLVTYTVPLSRIDELLDEHRCWLDENFADGTFLVSGPQVPRTGGTIIAAARSRRQIEQLLRSDPLVRTGSATYQIIEFSPTRGPYAPEHQLDGRSVPGTTG